MILVAGRLGASYILIIRSSLFFFFSFSFQTTYLLYARNHCIAFDAGTFIVC